MGTGLRFAGNVVLSWVLAGHGITVGPGHPNGTPK